MLKIIALLFLRISYANDCGQKPAVGFGLRSLVELRGQINQSYGVKEHCKKRKEVMSSLADQKTDEETLSNLISSSTLILLGEEHHTPAQRTYGDLLKKIRQKT